MRESGEMYLENILIIGKKKGFVRAIDLSMYMNFSKASVSRALSKLKAENYITVKDDGGIVLEKKGREVAEKIYERHEVLSKILRSMGVPEEVALEDACRIEHVISDESFEAIKKYSADI